MTTRGPVDIPRKSSELAKIAKILIDTQPVDANNWTHLQSSAQNIALSTDRIIV